MIDAATFAQRHNAFWHTAAPASELFVRRLNLELYDRLWRPLGAVAGVRASLTAELAFSGFVVMAARGLGHGDLSEEEGRHAWEEAVSRLAPYSRQGFDFAAPLNEDELRESNELRRRLVKFFGQRRGDLIPRPLFPGCGFVDSSEGDVISGGTLFEVKAVSRMFRSGDVRQILSYTALNESAGNYDIRKLGIINTKLGIVYEAPLDELAEGVAGMPASELLHHIREAISNAGISR